MSYRFNPWTAEEEARLLASSTSGISIHTIAERHNRSPNAIKMRLERMTLNHILRGKTAAEALRLTGLPMKCAQTSGKTDSVRPVAVAVHPMFTNMISRNDLRAIPEKRRLDAIRQFIENAIVHPVQNAAASGKTSYMYVPPKGCPRACGYPAPYEVTTADIIEGASAKFPGCKVGFSDEWVDVRPGVREHREGVLIDWS